MIPRECKRLAEVDFPIAEVSRHAVREKSIRHGLPSTLHLWWARRPLASSRAVLMALLLPDPCDPHCPPAFREEARRTLLGMTGRPSGWKDEIEANEGLRKVILKFIADFANWDHSAKRTWTETAKALVQAAHGDEAPLVVDPFAGGGSIPLEALRLGCEAFASDLNPVACLILKVMLEDIPRYGPGLAEDVRKVGESVSQKARRELSDLYPTDPDGAMPIAYLWARTVLCESPNCGAEIPLMKSLWLCGKPRRKRALRLSVERSDGGSPQIAFELFEPEETSEVHPGTVSRAKATCPCCRAVLPPDRVRSQLAAQRGGAEVIFDEDGNRIGGARMKAVVTLRPGERGRHYRLPTDADYAAVRNAQARVGRLLEEWKAGDKQGLCPIPDELLPPIGTLGFRVQRYGMLRWGDLFTARQKAALSTLVSWTASMMLDDADASLLAIGKLVDLGNALCEWMPGQECPSAVFKLGRVKPSWDFVEGCVTSESSGSLHKCTANLAAGITSASVNGASSGQVMQAMAQDSPLPDSSSAVYFTDPPYYDAIPYSDLSDFFLVWLKRTQPGHPLLLDPFDPDNPLSPKVGEAVQDETKRDANGCRKDGDWFEETMAEAFADGRRVLRSDGVGSVVFAHKTTEGWEALLSGMIRGGWTITGSWPIATEMPHRIRARESAALATSVHLICRPRPDDALVGDWARVLQELPVRVTAWMKRLQEEGIRGADLVFACVGPALEVFSRYRAVETAEGSEVGLPEYLERVWQVVGRAALEQVLGTADAGTLEEDARLTALFLWTYQSTDVGEGVAKDAKAERAASKAAARGLSLPYDVVRRFSQPMGIGLDRWNGRVIGQAQGLVRLLPVSERADELFGREGTDAAADWIEKDPQADPQSALFPIGETTPTPSTRRRRGARSILDPDDALQEPDATTLDRVHAGMLLQASGHANALRKLIAAERERGPAFLRLADALCALYPRWSREKRLLDAMILAVPR